MPDLDWNKSTWDGRYDWSRGGEEWSGPWGSSAAQWFATIMPRIGTFLPATSVLEIAPGFGRWTEFLLRFSRDYCGVDFSEQCVAACRERFHNRPRAEFFTNDGVSLECVEQRQFDLVFSYDSLVHADIEPVSRYIEQIVRLLTPGGAAFIHHSNLAALPGVAYGRRSENVSAEIVGNLVRDNGGRVMIQERFSWGEGHLSDCLTLFCRSGDYPDFEAQDIVDRNIGSSLAHAARERFQFWLRAGQSGHRASGP